MQSITIRKATSPTSHEMKLHRNVKKMNPKKISTIHWEPSPNPCEIHHPQRPKATAPESHECVSGARRKCLPEEPRND
jgi:hypothetical protein